MSSLHFIFISFSTFYASALIRVAVQMSPYPVPHNFFVALLGMTLGYLRSIYPVLDLMALPGDSPQIVMNIIVPVIMFEASFFTNLESFTIAGVQVALLVVSTFCLSVGMIGFIVVGAFDYGWGWIHAVILVSIILTPGPVVTMAFLKRMLAPLKLQYFLESEAITGNCLAFIIFKFCVLWSVNDILHIKDFIIGLCISPLFGFIVAKVIAYWMSKIMNDPVNQVCIVIASLYSCYLLAEISNMCGIISVVFMGIFMTGHRSNMNDKTERILLKFLHVLSSYFNCNLTMLCGMRLSVVIPTLTWRDCSNIIIVFILLNIIRIMTVAMLYPMIRKQGYCLSLNNLLVVGVCNIKGVVTVLLAFCLLLDDFRIPNKVKMFTIAVSQVVLSLLVNSTIANAVIRYDGVLVDILFLLLTSYMHLSYVYQVFGASKSHSISSTHAVLKDLQQDSIFVFKHNNKYLADADWKIVDKFTRIQHPLLSTSTTLKSKKAHADKRNMNKTIERQAYYRISMMMKCSYWKQFGEGLLSYNAVRQLLNWSNQALAGGNILIFPSKIQSSLTVPKFYENLKNDVLFKLQDWTLFGTHSRLFQTIFGNIVICIYIADLNLTLLQLSNEVFILDPEREFFCVWYNLIFLSCHGILFICMIFYQRKVTIWEIIIVLLVSIGAIDLFVMKTINTETSWSKFLRLLFMTTRLLRVIRVVEVLPFILRFLLKMCELNINILLTDGFDIARSFIRGQIEVMRLLNHVEPDIPDSILNKFKNVCTNHKLKTVRMLELFQMKYPVISASATTRQAIRAIMTKQLTVLMNLDKIRMLRHKDGTVLEKVIMSRMAKSLDKLVTVMPPSYKETIARVPWVQGDERIMSLIMEIGEIVKYKSSEYIVTHSSQPGGLFIILKGIAVLRRRPMESSDLVEEQVMDYLTTGSVIGEFTFLTGKARHKAVVCETNMLVMYIRFKYLWQYIGERPNVSRLKLSKLEERMWKVVAIKLAYRLLIAESDWHHLSQNEILCKLIDGMIIDGHSDPQSFNHYIQTSDLILIYGKLVDLASNEIIAGPVFIPKGHGHFSLLNDGKLRPILYILPTYEDGLQPRRFKTRWDLCTVTEARSDVTLSSGGSSFRPSFVPRNAYFGSSAVSATSESIELDPIQFFRCETEV